MALSRDEILARKVHGETDQVPLGDGFVVVRGLTRGEAHETVDKPAAEVEAIALHHGLVEPAMSLDDCRAWIAQDRSGDVDNVVKAIQRLSGNETGQGKEYTKSLSRSRSRANR